MQKEGRIIDNNLSHYDFRHVVIDPKLMSARELQLGADWLYNKFYRLGNILIRTIYALFKEGPLQAYLGFKLGMTYRYDNKREKIKGANPAKSKIKNKKMFDFTGNLIKFIRVNYNN